MLDLLPRVKARGGNRAAEGCDGVSVAAAHDSVQISSEKREETLATAAAALLRQASPAAVQSPACVPAATGEARHSGRKVLQRYETSKLHQKQWGGAFVSAEAPATASRVTATTSKTAFTGGSSGPCSPDEGEAGADLPSTTDWQEKESFCCDDRLLAIHREASFQTSMETSVPYLGLDSPSSGKSSMPAFYSAQHAGKAAARVLPPQNFLEGSV